MIGRLSMVAFLWAGVAVAEPGLHVYVTDDNRDVFVAVNAGKSFELSGCADATAARMVLDLPTSVAVTETTFVALTEASELGQHPAIPCVPGPLGEALWPQDSLIWADIEDGARYILAAPAGTGHYVIPLACEGVKDALDVRGRTQRLAAFQGFGTPDPLAVIAVLDCGTGASAPVPGVDPESAAPTGWALHSYEVFLSETGGPEQIFVAAGPLGDGTGYLPIMRLNGVETPDVFAQGGAARAEAETTLKTLLGIAPEAAVTPLGFEALTGVQTGLFADLCTRDCAGYSHAHAYLADPNFDVDLSRGDVRALPPARDVLGNLVATIGFAGARRLSLTDCAALAQALGAQTQVAQTANWAQQMAEAHATADAGAQSFVCPAAPQDTCLRRLSEGDVLTAAILQPGGTCAGKSTLVLEVPELTRAPAALELDGQAGFARIILRPAPGVERAVLQISAGRSSAGSTCLLSAPRMMLHAYGGLHLRLQHITLRRAQQEAMGGEAIALHIDDGVLVAQGLHVLSDGDASMPPERGISLCSGDLYARGLRVDARALAVQATASRVALTGTDEAPTTLSSPEYALSLSGGSLAQASRINLTARTGMLLSQARAFGRRITMVSSDPQAGLSTAVQLRGASKADLQQSTALGFTCVGTFWSPLAEARFVLPGNDLSQDNMRVSCGRGTVSILE